MILALLVKHYAPYQGSKPVFERRQRDLDRLRPVFAFIDRHCSDPIGVEDAAAIIHMSKRNFTRFFKKVTGQTLMDYLQALRIERARHLLASTGKTIAEIALEVGFCNQSYFGVVFHRLAQMSAHEYRKQISLSPPGQLLFTKPTANKDPVITPSHEGFQVSPVGSALLKTSRYSPRP